jgi:hypothetical protein
LVFQNQKKCQKANPNPKTEQKGKKEKGEMGSTMLFSPGFQVEFLF